MERTLESRGELMYMCINYDNDINKLHLGDWIEGVDTEGEKLLNPGIENLS